MKQDDDPNGWMLAIQEAEIRDVIDEVLTDRDQSVALPLDLIQLDLSFTDMSPENSFKQILVQITARSPLTRIQRMGQT
jgi:hypothetical protein